MISTDTMGQNPAWVKWWSRDEDMLVTNEAFSFATVLPRLKSVRTRVVRGPLRHTLNTTFVFSSRRL